jgi:hypothetical protein
VIVHVDTHALHLTEVLGADADDVFTKLLLDELHLVPRLLIVNEENGNTLAAETTGTT